MGTDPQKGHVGTFAEGEETLPEDTHVATFAEGDEALSGGNSARDEDRTSR